MHEQQSRRHINGLRLHTADRRVVNDALRAGRLHFFVDLELVGLGGREVAQVEEQLVNAVSGLSRYCGAVRRQVVLGCADGGRAAKCFGDSH